MDNAPRSSRRPTGLRPLTDSELNALLSSTGKRSTSAEIKRQLGEGQSSKSSKTNTAEESGIHTRTRQRRRLNSDTQNQGQPNAMVYSSDTQVLNALTELYENPVTGLSSNLVLPIRVQVLEHGSTSAEELDDKDAFSGWIGHLYMGMDILKITNNDSTLLAYIHEQLKMEKGKYKDFRDPSHKCSFCQAIFWYDERKNKSAENTSNPLYSKCCLNGKVELPLVEEPPTVLQELLYGNSDKTKHFIDNIRAYNMMFSFTSMGGEIDKRFNDGRGPPVFQLHGQNYHLLGSLLPAAGKDPQFAQLYIYDTDHEISNRMRAIGGSSNNFNLDEEIISDIKDMLDKHNLLVQSFRIVRETQRGGTNGNIRLRLIGKRNRDGRQYNMPAKNEVAALIVNDFENLVGNRDIIVETRSGQLQRINELHVLYLPLQYPLLFVYGQDGYRDDILYSGRILGQGRGRARVSLREWFVYRLQERDCESKNILFSRKLFQQFVVDGYSMVESQRLAYVRFHQKELRSEMYKGLNDALCKGESDPTSTGKRIVLPASFTGGARYMIQCYQDAMAICRWAGYPDLFITFTCNPKWPKITRFVESRGLRPEDRPDIVSRLFKMKLYRMIKDIKDDELFGKVRAVVYTIEFQKRGLPHAHILVFMAQNAKFSTPNSINNIISAEIPNEIVDPEYYAAVREFMIHGPCGHLKPNSPCMANDRCTKKYPKRFVQLTNVDDDGFPTYRRRDDGRTVRKNGNDLDNRFVVPHNRCLLLRYRAHINVEWCNQSRSIKYLFKYLSKGCDRITANFYKSVGNGVDEDNVDEIRMYYDCRYLSPCEAVWRMFRYDIHYRTPSVERLFIHLPDEQQVMYAETDRLENVINRPTAKQSMFTAWMDANREYESAKLLTYEEFPNHFIWDDGERAWYPRKQGWSIGRIQYIAPDRGELYFLRVLVGKVRGPTCYEKIRTFNGVTYATFREACYARGLLDDDKEYIEGIVEASHWGTGPQIRGLFATLLMSESLSQPVSVWNRCWKYMEDDIVHRRKTSSGLPLSEEEIKNAILLDVERILNKRGRTLSDFTSMPLPEDVDATVIDNRLIVEETAYDTSTMTAEYMTSVQLMTDEQKNVFDTIMGAVDTNIGGVFFVYGYGGTGKTFIWKTLSAAIRSRGDIVLNVASSGIASLLLLGGRTAHSRFAIPINLTEDSTCHISQGSPLAELICRAKLIIWDEAPMTHRYCFEALDRTMKDLLRFDNPQSTEQPFGGKTIVFGGDFRQILPVIQGGTRQDIVFATLNSSPLWSHCKVMKLTRNMRLQNAANDNDALELEAFSEWMCSIGDGTIGDDNHGEATIDMPDDTLITVSNDLVHSIVESTYPSFVEKYGDASYLQGRAILAPTLNEVQVVNDYMVSKNPSVENVYLSADSVCDSSELGSLFAEIHSAEFLNGIRCSGVPNHELKLKVGIPVMLLRNIDHTMGLCNGTRLIITRLGRHVLEASILSGGSTGEKVFIPRMSLTPSDMRLPFQLKKRQFPLIVSYAMTINKSQGQSLSHVGLFLRKPVFSHGQLYVAISRVTNRSGLKVLMCDENGNPTNRTTNVVFKEVFQNL